jgi:peptidoglycan/LPS O-acetylase OafA/YrhL
MRTAAMTGKTTLPTKRLQKVRIAIRFIIFGVGGFLLLIVNWLALVLRFSSPPETTINPFLAFLLALVGALMMLFGVDEWGRWAYLWVFVSTPLVVSLILIIPWPKWVENTNWGGKDAGVLFFALPFIASYIAVRSYYRRRDARNTPMARKDLPVPVSEEQTSK